jgi:hypothetical protein
VSQLGLDTGSVALTRRSGSGWLDSDTGFIFPAATPRNAALILGLAWMALL